MHPLACAALALLTLTAGERDDAAARKAWSYMLPAEQDDALARFDGECGAHGFLQSRLIKHASSLAEFDSAAAEADPGIAHYDPKVHAPAQPIARKLLDADSKAAVKRRESMLGAALAKETRSEFRYDWGTRKVVRCIAADDRDAHFELALAGRGPHFDWARAWVERALDGGAEQKTLAAFGHAYTDRAGGVYPGLTLYDAWASGAEMEMPDVDTLGLVHELKDDWKTWVAPVPDTQHRPLYAAIGAHFVPAHRYRGLREALARCYLAGTPLMRDGYEAQIDRFHALWAACASKPSTLAAKLPATGDNADFLERWTLESEETESVRDAGRARRAELDRDRVAIRALMLQILEESGAFERSAKPAPNKPAK